MQVRVLRVVTTALVALSLALACGEEKSDDDDGASDSCPADAPGNATDCAGYAPGLACTYDSITCTCSGISWNCTQGGGMGSTSTTGTPTGSGGNGFGPNGGNGFGPGSTGAPFGGD